MLLKRFEKLDEPYSEIVRDDNGYLKLLRFGLIQLPAEKGVSSKSDEVETVLVILQGSAKIQVNNITFEQLHRKSVFAEKATAVYVPVQADFTVTNTGDSLLEIAVCQSGATEVHEPFVIRPDDVYSRFVGEDNWQREVHDIVVKNAEGKVHRILVGETFNPKGNWSSYPPHKHDDYKPGVEACMEEVYHYRVEPEPGFGVQSIYTADRTLDETYSVRNRDTFMIPYGYHPVCAAGGYKLYYLWVMAGEIDRVMIPNDDPNHAWVRQDQS